jgi:TRAP-type C4-dicarboxylate transport system substrate-binding protein
MSVTLAAAALAALGCGAGSGSSEHWRFALEEIRGSVQHACAERFRERIEEGSGGRVRVTIHPYGSLGTSAQITEQLQAGALQLAFASPGHLGSVVPEVQVFSLHFVFPETEEALRDLLRDERLLAPLRAAYRDHRLALLAVVSEGFMVWSGNKPLVTPADFDGFKMRTMASPLLVEAYRAYGANPTPLPYAEVYGALQLGMVDGQVNPIFAIAEMGFHEVQDVLTEARHLPFVTTLAAHPGFLDGLPPDLRALLDAAVADLHDHSFAVERRLNAERLERILAAGGTRLVRLSEPQRAAFRARSLPVRERYLELAGARGARILEVLLHGPGDS